VGIAPLRSSSKSTLQTDRVARVLADLSRLAEAEDPPAKERVLQREHELGPRVWGAERAAACGSAPLSITPEVGELLYVLGVARRPRTIVEFGASHAGTTCFPHPRGRVHHVSR
jgi:predicted O-methyltransferase YrrM